MESQTKWCEGDWVQFTGKLEPLRKNKYHMKIKDQEIYYSSELDASLLSYRTFLSPGDVGVIQKATNSAKVFKSRSKDLPHCYTVKWSQPPMDEQQFRATVYTLMYEHELEEPWEWDEV